MAIKRIRSGFAQDPFFANLFIEEARLTARLQHPNIVQVLDLDRDHDGGLFLVMELVDGVTLHSLLQRCRLPLSLVIHVALEILRGLDYAHELPLNVEGVRGIVHRDLSPDNVLLSWEGAVKISDFGVAKARDASKATASITIKGKPSYMSPEQVNGAALDGRSDLFAVGVIMFEMLSGRSLFVGGTNGETLGHVLYAKIPSVRDIRPEVPQDLSSAPSAMGGLWGTRRAVARAVAIARGVRDASACGAAHVPKRRPGAQSGGLVCVRRPLLRERRSMRIRARHLAGTRIRLAILLAEPEGCSVAPRSATGSVVSEVREGLAVHR